MNSSHDISPKKGELSLRSIVIAVVAFLAATAFATALLPVKDNKPIKPIVPTINRYQNDKVFLEQADELRMNEGDTFQILNGNVVFRRADMYMYCDSAHYYDQSESFEAYGNVRMQQGDTLFIYADFLDYDGKQELAMLTMDDPMDSVRLINRTTKLTTPVFFFDRKQQRGYYENVGGVLTDRLNRLESINGEYFVNTKDANFTGQVILNSRQRNGDLLMTTETLYYNTFTHLARLVSATDIYNADGRLYTSNGTYDTRLGLADLYDRSLVVTKTEKTLTGDTLFYDRINGFGEAYGNMVITDRINKMTLTGDYGFYDEVIDSAFVTGNALATEYSKPDTIFMHGDSISAFIDVKEVPVDSLGNILDEIKDSTEVEMVDDTTHYVIVHPHVRFFRKDIQGLCDSLTYVQEDSMLYLDVHPVMWSGLVNAPSTRQIFGGTIHVHFNDSTADWAYLPQSGFVAEAIEGDFYNQLSGKEMKAFFVNQDLKHLDVKGNVQAVFLPQENDSTYNKITNIESSFLAADFNNRQLEKMKLWTQTNGTVTPLYLAKRSLYYLPQFKWYEHLRPLSPEDVFSYPEGMDELLNGPDPTARRSVNLSPKVEDKP